MKKILCIILPICIILTGCTANKAENNSIKSLYGTWYIGKFLGTTIIYTEEENQNDVVGGTLTINKEGIFYNNEQIIEKPNVVVSPVTYDEILVDRRTEPSIFGMKQDDIYELYQIYDTVDPTNSLLLIKKDAENIIYYRNSKYYLLNRK